MNTWHQSELREQCRQFRNTVYLAVVVSCGLKEGSNNFGLQPVLVVSEVFRTTLNVQVAKDNCIVLATSITQLIQECQ